MIIDTLRDILINNNICISQLQYYKNNNSIPEVLELIKYNSKTLGSICEKTTIKHFNLIKSNIYDYDAIYDNIKFEIKSSRYWVSVNDWKWQHIMRELQYDYVIFVGIDYTSLRFFIIKKLMLLDLYYQDLDIVKQQGNGEGQGLWTNYKKIRIFCKEIFTKFDLLDYIKNEN